MHDVSVVVGNHQGAAVLGDCLASLRAQTRQPTEVIVVDGASTDESEDIAEEYGAHWVPEANRGLGYLYNRGAELATSEYVLFANNDIALDERCLELLRQQLDTDPSLFAADARQMGWDGTQLVHGRATLRRGRLLHELLPGFHLDQQGSTDEVVATVTANGACMLVRRSMARELGGFDETFFLDYEDLDLCWRAWLRGWGSIYVPSAWLRHRVGAATTSALLPRRISSSHHNLMRFALKCLPARDAVRIIATEALRLGRHPRPIAFAFAGLASELPEILRLRRRLRPNTDLLAWMLVGQPPGLRPNLVASLDAS